MALCQSETRAPLAGHVAAVSIAAFLLVLVAVLAIVIAAPLKDDVAWLLHVGRAILHGHQLYTDIVEINPPLIVWISAVPAFLADATGAPIEPLAALFFAAIVLAPVWWSATILRGYSPLFAQRAPVFAICAIVFLIVPGVEFGQREHLIVAFALPYLCLFARRLQQSEPRRLEALAVGILAALACALKPRYAIAFGLLEVVAVTQGLRLWRAEVIGGSAAFLGYAALVFVLFPAYIDTIVPMTLALYGASDASGVKLFLASHTLLLAELVVLALLLRRTGRRRRDPLLLTLAVFAIGATLTCFAQDKDWFYHRLPATIVVWLALIYGAATVIADAPRTSLKYGLLLLVACTIGLLGEGAWARFESRLMMALHRDSTFEARLEHLIARSRARTYMAFSQSLSPAFPVVNDTGAAWTSRFDSMWALRGLQWRLAHGRPYSELPVTGWIVRDFVKARPDLVVIDDRDGLNYLSILSHSPEFAAAWSSYRLEAAFDGIRAFRRAPLTASAVNRPLPRFSAP